VVFITKIRGGNGARFTFQGWNKRRQQNFKTTVKQLIPKTGKTKYIYVFERKKQYPFIFYP
jgi:hypothetical protein